MENTKLFVYGTLKKGFSNHSIIQKTTYIGDFISIDKFSEIVGSYILEDL